MGMTYSAYIIPKGSVDFKKYENEAWLDPLMEAIDRVGQYIIDEYTFDHERLGIWLGLTKEQSDSAHDNGYCIITVEQIKHALKVLKDLEDRVHAMPFSLDGKNVEKDRKWNEERKEYIGVWDGPGENEVIYREVMKVFSRDYHYIWPWDKSEYKRSIWGCSGYIEVLESALESAEDAMTSPDYPNGCEIVLMYY